MSTSIVKSFGGLVIKSAEKGEIEAIVATLLVVDKDEDIILPDAIADGSKVSMSSYGHNVVFGETPVGKGVLRIRGDKVVFVGKMFLATQAGRETFEVLKEIGSDQPWSFGFRILGSEVPSEQQRKQGARRILTKLDAFEVSPVVVAAGLGTQTLSAKSESTDTDPLEERFKEVAAIARNLQQLELDEIKRKGAAVVKQVEQSELCEIQEDIKRRKDTIANIEASELFRKFRNDPAYDPRPSWRESYLVDRLQSSEGARNGIPSEDRPRVRWFSADGVKWGSYRPHTHEIYLQIGLDEERLIHVWGHEYEHMKAHGRGFEQSEAICDLAGDWLLQRVRDGMVDGVKVCRET